MVRGAVDARRKLSVAYEDRDGAITTRVLRPLGLWFWGQTWTLAAWCELREDYRSFRVDRLDDIVVLDDAFDDDPDMTVARFLEARRAREG